MTPCKFKAKKLAVRTAWPAEQAEFFAYMAEKMDRARWTLARMLAKDVEDRIYGRRKGSRPMNINQYASHLAKEIQHLAVRENRATVISVAQVREILDLIRGDCSDAFRIYAEIDGDLIGPNAYLRTLTGYSLRQWWNIAIPERP